MSVVLETEENLKKKTQCFSLEMPDTRRDTFKAEHMDYACLSVIARMNVHIKECFPCVQVSETFMNTAASRMCK